jgi:hypothetical protein
VQHPALARGVHPIGKELVELLFRKKLAEGRELYRRNRREALGKVIEQTIMRETATYLGLEGVAAEPVPWEEQPAGYRESYRRVADAVLKEIGLG